MDPFFAELGRAVAEHWKRENFAPEKFPQIARSALEKKPPAKHVDLAGFMRDFLLSDQQPAQTDSDFGEPEIVAFKHPRFYIQLLFWLDGTTAIHQHAFSGAFHVMHGSSIHASYEFENARAVTDFLHVGDLRMKRIELLETGRTVPIISGRQTIHSLFHLDLPSVTVVLRTQHHPGTGPQFNYLPPRVAIDPLHDDLLSMRRRQLLGVLEQVEDDGYPEVVTRMIADLDFESGFHLLRYCMPYLGELGAWTDVVKTFEKKHKALAAGIETTLREEARRGSIKALRGSIIEPEHRFFLALLMNAPSRKDLFSLVKQRFPMQAPGDVVLRWVQELMEVSEQGTAILDAVFPESLEAALDDQADLFLSAFAHFSKRDKKMPRSLRDRPAADLKLLRAVFAASALGILID